VAGIGAICFQADMPGNYILQGIQQIGWQKFSVVPAVF
jgi:hypothetical protein